MPTGNHLGIDEPAIAEAVARMIRDASVDIELTVQRYLLRGDKFPSRVLADLYRALMDVAEQYAVDLTKSVWGREIIAAARKGANAVPGASFSLSREQIDIAMSNAGRKIKGVLEAGIAETQDIVASGMFRGDSLKDIAAQIQKRVQVSGVIDQFRAETIAIDETFSVYRQSSKMAANAEGIDLFQMRGPADLRTSKICRDHVGEVHTVEEWAAIRLAVGDKSGPKNLDDAKDFVFSIGLHHRCRHSFDPVPRADAPYIKRYQDVVKGQLEASAA